MTITASLSLHRPRVGGALLKLGAAVMGGPIFFREVRFLKQQSRRRYAANGFAFVPPRCRWAALVGCRTGGEVLRGFTFVPRAEGTIQFDQGSIASALKTIYGHKRMPRQTSVGARMTSFGDEERMSVPKPIRPLRRLL